MVGLGAAAYPIRFHKSNSDSCLATKTTKTKIKLNGDLTNY